MIKDLERWRADLMFCGDLIQDGDDRDAIDPAEEALRSGHEYVALLDLVEGDEPDIVFQSLIDSMQAEEDYGVYESTLGQPSSSGHGPGRCSSERSRLDGWSEILNVPAIGSVNSPSWAERIRRSSDSTRHGRRRVRSSPRVS